MRSALRKLCRHGVEALRPQRVNDKWRKPAISKRIASDVRKTAIRNGTFGQFDSATGIGWDPAWDAPESKKSIAINELIGGGGDITAEEAVESIFAASNSGAIQSIRPPKETKRERTRESRAQKIEKLLEVADEKIEEYRLELESQKPKPGIEEEFKAALKASRY